MNLKTRIRITIQPHTLLCANFQLQDQTDKERRDEEVLLPVGHSKKDYADVLEQIASIEKDGYRLGYGSIVWTKTPGVWARLDRHFVRASPMWTLYECPEIYPRLQG